MACQKSRSAASARPDLRIGDALLADSHLLKQPLPSGAAFTSTLSAPLNQRSGRQRCAQALPASEGRLRFA
jgi:hypothetical protein